MEHSEQSTFSIFAFLNGDDMAVFIVLIVFSFGLCLCCSAASFALCIRSQRIRHSKCGHHSLSKQPPSHDDHLEDVDHQGRCPVVQSGAGAMELKLPSLWHSQNRSPLTMETDNDLWRIIVNKEHCEGMESMRMVRDSDISMSNPYLVHLTRLPLVAPYSASTVSSIAAPPNDISGAAVSGLSPRNMSIERNMSLLSSAPQRRSSRFRGRVCSVPGDPNPVYLIAPLEEHRADDTLRCSDSEGSSEGTNCTVKRVMNRDPTLMMEGDSDDDIDSTLYRVYPVKQTVVRPFHAVR